MTDSEYDPDHEVDIEEPRENIVLSSRFVRALLGFVHGISQAISDWWHTRRWMRMVQGVPALLIAGVILLPAALHGWATHDQLAIRYRGEVNRAVAQNDPESADLYLQKLQQFNALDPAMQYAMAFVAMRKGETERGTGILTELANDENGDPRAHLWKAKQIAAGKTNWSAEERPQLIRHLELALKAEQSAPEANLLLGRIYLQSQEYDKAIQHLQSASASHPELNLTLGQLYLLRGDKPRANASLQQAAEHFERKVLTAKTDANARVAWALTYRLQNNYVRAREILVEGLKIDANAAPLREAMAAFYIDEFDGLSARADVDFDKRLQLLEAALTFAPNHPAALDRLATLCSVEGETGERARSRLADVLASGKATATIHLILGVQALTKGDSKKAALHFEQGYGQNPKFPVLLNNFAWLLAHQEKPELDRALTMVNQALAISPNEPNIRETRGQIYVKLGRWREALADLEFALPKMAGNKDLHASLARTYRELGDTEIAEKHAKLAEGK